MKVRKTGCELKIGELVLEGSHVQGEGRAGLVSGGGLHELPNW